MKTAPLLSTSATHRQMGRSLRRAENECSTFRRMSDPHAAEGAVLFPCGGRRCAFPPYRGLILATNRIGRGLGFTLIELIITVTIIGVLASIGIPAYSGFVAGQRVKNASFDLMSTLMLARSEALKRNTIVTVTPTTGGDWASGWSVTVGATTLNQQAAFKKLAITGPASVSYNNSGRLSTAATAFSLSSTGSNAIPRCISVSFSGRPNSKKGACS